MAAAILVKNLAKHFGHVHAVDDISFSIEEGKIIGFLGPNGAGKTTTIHLLLGLITPTAGSIHIFGKDLTHAREEILQRMNFSSPYVYLPARLSVFENLMVFAKLYHVSRPEKRIKELLKLFRLTSFINTPQARLSAGENTRVGLVKALLNKPRILLLDEPTASLDPHAARETRDILQEIQQKEGMTILYTSHNMAEVELLCEEIIFLNHGKIVAQGTPVEITKSILKTEEQEPDLEEVFFHIANKNIESENSSL